ncbi:uncharacterized protein N7511_006831 [Penicillium nucicola]|uniref:uncharacterized protein n=1 Tax=Penicillium nucicola TaxID=1850975 RepID=UPI00254510DC|nr:uncharacterized protein N7511_006831 [Penicillium nucicola]KAJ5758137.1 hypothetical protein N7511_006831 [Penicillium nucicola]
MAGSESDEDDSNEVVISMDGFQSDGDITTWPESPYSQRDDTRWRKLLAENWLKSQGSYVEGDDYIIPELPDGYALFDKPRNNNPSISDPFLFGHPSGQYFQSQITFFTHFLSLAQGKLSECQCKPCSKMGGTKKPASPGANRPARGPGVHGPGVRGPGVRGPGRPIEDKDSDYWRDYVLKLKAKGSIDEPNEQPLNFDWALSHEMLSDYFNKLVLDPAFVPRCGELVLCVWEMADTSSLLRSPENGRLEICDKHNRWWVPDWRAGVVTQPPESDIRVAEITENPYTTEELSNHGFRIELLPDPLGLDKSYSVQSKYLPLRCIKPFNSWQLYLHKESRDNLHPSIENALTVMASWSVTHKFHVKGVWPNMEIGCKGVWVGAELLAVHDTVRLKPRKYTIDDLRDGKLRQVDDVMIIDNINLVLTDCIDDPTSPNLAQQYSVRITGKMYTNNPHRNPNSDEPLSKLPLQVMTNEEATATFRQVGMSAYGPWYRVAGDKPPRLTISQGMILGRCYEPLAMDLLLGKRDFGYDLNGVLHGRNFSEGVDTRIAEGKTWFWGDSRIETLGIVEINGVECDMTAPQRETPARWRAIFKILSGEVTPALIRRAGIPPTMKSASRNVGRPKGSKNKKPKTAVAKSGLAQVAQTSKLVSSAIGTAPEEETSDDLEDGLGSGSGPASLPLAGDGYESDFGL